MSTDESPARAVTWMTGRDDDSTTRRRIRSRTLPRDAAQPQGLPGRDHGRGGARPGWLQHRRGAALQFDLSRDINAAARDVQAAINAAAGFLPSNLPTNP